ncbi:MAG: VOC family protein [Tenericutes bacterium]|nr:VOC family protein [Mycoplasmatota bacterium]
MRSDVTFNSLIPELSVSNIEKSVEFYKKIGFKVIYERLENKFCFLELEHNQLMIEEINDNWNTAILEYPFGRGINISMSVLDIEKMYNNLKDKNIEIFKELECHTYKVNEVIYKDKEFLIQDPDGYLLRFNN